MALKKAITYAGVSFPNAYHLVTGFQFQGATVVRAQVNVAVYADATVYAAGASPLYNLSISDVVIDPDAEGTTLGVWDDALIANDVATEADPIFEAV